MKQIQPINIWVNGETKTGVNFSVTCINDNYESSATNYWQMFTKVEDAEGVESAGESVAQGNLSISGESYIEWGDIPAMGVNAWIYDWVANELNLVILP